MLLKLLQRSTLFTVFIFAFFTVSAQKTANNSINLQTILNNSINENTGFYNGIIILNNSDTLAGKININHFKIKTEYHTAIEAENSNAYLANKNIASVTLLKQKNIPETKFVRINTTDKLYRTVYTNGNNIYVYDGSNTPIDGKLIDDIFVKEDGILTNTFNFWSSGPKKDLINYLSQRDGLKYKRKDFKTLQELFDII